MKMLLIVALFSLCSITHATIDTNFASTGDQRFFYGLNPHPAVVSVGNFRDLHICNGILVAEDVVLTAAHCVNDVQNNLSIRSKSRVVGFGGQTVEVKKNCPLTGYDFVTKHNDISILRLATAVSNVRPAKLPVDDESQSGRPGLTTAQGWGFNTKGLIQAVPVVRVGETACKSQYGNDAVTDSMQCVAYRGWPMSSCLDAAQGSPIIINDTVVGITAAVGSCTTVGPPAVYTKVLKNIQSDIDQCI